MIKMGDEKKRLVAIKLWIKDVINSRYIKEEGLRPNYILTQNNQKISRLNLIGTVISLEEGVGYFNAFIDDGSGKISIRSFEQNESLANVKLGDSIVVIGRPREYNNEMFILPEIIKKLEDMAWLEVRKIELTRNIYHGNTEVAKAIEEKGEYIEDSGVRQKIYDIIKKSDAGEGVLYEAVLNFVQMEETQKTIEGMIKNGELFEISKGRLKVV